MAMLEYLKVVRRRWPVVLACFLLAAVTAYILSPEQSAQPKGDGFQAAVTLVPPVDTSAPPNLYLAARLTTTPDVAKLAAAQLPPDVRPSNKSAIAANVNPEAGAITVSATDIDKNRANLLAQAYALATIEFVRTAMAGSQEEALAAAKKELKSVEKTIITLQDDINSNPNNAVAQARLDTEMARYGIVFQRMQSLLEAEQSAASLQVIGTPEVTPLEPGISPPSDRRVRALLAGVLGLVLGLGVALAVDRLDSRLRERDEVEEAFGLPVLAEIPRISRRARADHALLTAARPDSAVAEAYRSLRSAIMLVAQSRRNDDGAATARSIPQTQQVLVVTGAQGREGKSTTVVNLAAALAETGKTVIVIDGDFRKPEAHHFLGALSGRGLTEVTDGYLDEVLRSTAVTGVSLVTTGRAVSQPASVLPRLAGLIQDARRHADIVLIDSSPLLLASEAVDVLQYADAALVACRLGRTTHEQARRARKLLLRAEVPLLGVVLTGAPRRRGTPYGQPTRAQAVRSTLAGWAQAASPDHGRYTSPSHTDAATDDTQELAVDAIAPDIQEHRSEQQLEKRNEQQIGLRQELYEPSDDEQPLDPHRHMHQPQDQPDDQQRQERRYQRRHERPEEQSEERRNGGSAKPPEEWHSHPWRESDSLEEKPQDELPDHGRETREEETAWSGG